MRSFVVIFLRLVARLIVAIATFSCSPDDVGIPTNVARFAKMEYYTIPGSSIIIDLRPAIDQPFSSITLRILKNPAKGTLKQVDTALFKYTPYTNFGEGNDTFELSAVLDNKTILRNEAMTIFMKESMSEFPCGVYGVGDYARLEDETSASIRPMANDRICGMNEPLTLSIKVPPAFGEAVVDGDAILYTPGPSLTAGDELVYSLSTSDGSETWYGSASFNNSKIDVIHLPSYYGDIYFISDTVGFVAGAGSILKTVDGGAHWRALNFPDVLGVIDFEEIFFLDEQRGFAAFSICHSFEPLQDCLGGWMKTADGGESWARVNLNHQVKSIFFLSTLTGFITTSKYGSIYPTKHNTIRKTTDGGETWDEVHSSTSGGGSLAIHFASDMVGYAYQSDRIISTLDGGSSWTQILAVEGPIATRRYVASLATPSENVVSASFTADFSPLNPSTLSLSEDGASWSAVDDFSYVILQHAFSPSGDLGVAVGINALEPVYSLAINSSNDKGKTWTVLPAKMDAYPVAISVPSENVAYILCQSKVIKYKP